MSKEINRIHQLISRGNQQGYLLVEEIEETFLDNMDAGEDFDEFISSIENCGIRIHYKGARVIPKRKKIDIVLSKNLELTTDPVLKTMNVSRLPNTRLSLLYFYIKILLSFDLAALPCYKS